jgi:hypothetical protein
MWVTIGRYVKIAMKAGNNVGHISYQNGALADFSNSHPETGLTVCERTHVGRRPVNRTFNVACIEKHILSQSAHCCNKHVADWPVVLKAFVRIKPRISIEGVSMACWPDALNLFMSSHHLKSTRHPVDLQAASKHPIAAVCNFFKLPILGARI